MLPALMLGVVGGFVSGVPVAAAGTACASNAEVRAEIQAFVEDIRDDVKSNRAREATGLALAESMRTYRGEKAETAQERAALGEQIAALASRQQETENRVEGKALAVAIRALTEQRERGPFTDEEREALGRSLAALRRAVVDRASNATEGQEIAAAFKALVAEFGYQPA